MSTEMTKTETSPKNTVRPRVDVLENDAEWLVVADLPGVAKDAVNIRFEANELAIDARRPAATTGGLLAEEYRTSDFRRVFAMPDGIDAEKIEARLEHGVLEVKLPKVAAKRPRKIAISG
jgi:HSP20 family molecular chaperone IbpA